MAIHEELRPDDDSLPYLMARLARGLSVDNAARTAGRVAVPNADGTSETILGANGVASWVGDTTPPGRPLGVNATAHLGTALVRWDGELEGGIPEDFLRVDVYARKAGDSGEGTLVGSMRDAGETATGVFDAGSTIDVWAVALDNAHDSNGFPAYNVSEESEHVQVEILPIVSQQEFDEAADNILAAADESAKAHVELVESTMDEISDAVAENTDAIELEKTLREEGVKAAQDTANNVKFETEKLKGDYAGMATDVANAQADIVKLATQTGNLAETTIVKSVVEYAVGTSNTIAPTLSTYWTGEPNNSPSVLVDPWCTETPTHTPGSYMWMRTRVTYGDGHQDVSSPVLVTGNTGAPGEPGKAGLPGTPGSNGKTSYLHLAYSNSADGSKDFSVSDSNRDYIGQYTDFSEADSTDHKKYTWSKIKGAQGAPGLKGDPGDKGLPGAPGADGRTSYAHFAYANSSDGRTDFSTTNGVGKSYIGQYVDFTEADSTDPTRYTWSLVKGPQGNPGAQGVSVTAITPFYCITSSKPAQPTNKAPGGSWTTTEPAYVKDKSLYTCQRVDYSNGQWSWTTVQLSSSYGLASVALMTANGKNKRWVQKDAPSSADLQQSDEWWQTSSKPLETYWTGEPNNSPSVLVDHSDEVEHIYVWNGSRWNEQLLSAQYLIVPGTIDAGLVTARFFDGAVVKGGAFLTSNERIRLTNAGFIMVDASGHPLVTLDATTGTATFQDVHIIDGVMSAGEVVGATIKGGEYNILDKSGRQIGTINSSGMDLGGKLVYGYSSTLKQYCLTLDGIIMAKGEMRGGTMVAPYIYSNAEYNSSDPKRKYRGVAITDGGMLIYKGNGTDDTIFAFDVSQNKLIMDGAIQTNGEIRGAKLTGDIVNGGKVVGGTISTRSEDKRGITLNGNQLNAYNEQGQTILSLNGAGNGTALLTGGLKTAQSGRRLEVTNQVYDSVSVGAISGYDTVGESWHIVGTSDRTNGTSTDWYTASLEIGINPQQPEFAVRYYNRYQVTVMSMLADRIDIVGSGSGESPYGTGVYVNNQRIDWQQEWHDLTLKSGLSAVGSAPQYGQRAGLLCFRGRIRCTANGDSALTDLSLAFPGFQKSAVNRTWIIGTMKNNVASTARCYISANTTVLSVNGGPWDWVDIGSVVIAL